MTSQSFKNKNKYRPFLLLCKVLKINKDKEATCQVDNLIKTQRNF